MLRIPQIGDRIRMLIPTISDNLDDVETTTPVGTVFEVERRCMVRGRQGLQFQLASAEYGVCVFIDQTDLVDGSYPFEAALTTA